MGNDPSKETSDEQAARDAAYAPRPFIVALGFVVMFLLHAIQHDRMPDGGTLSYVIAGYGFSALTASLALTPVIRWMRRLSWRAAVLYGATVCVGMFLGDVAYALLFMR